MKKIIYVFATCSLFLFSCSTEVGHDSVDNYVEPVKEESQQEEQVEEVAEVQVPVSEKDMETDFRIVNFFKEGESGYIQVRKITYEEDENATWGRSLGVPVVAEDTLTFRFEQGSYFDCSHTDQIAVDSIETKWKKNEFNPIRIKTEAGIVKEFYYDECSG